MAAQRRSGSYRGQYDRRNNRHSQVYADGNTLRKVQAEPRRVREQATATSASTISNRERALQMNMGYVVFLTAAAIITVFMCVNYLKLQSANTKLSKEVTALETTLDAAILENDSDYDRVMTSIDIEHVKDVAMNKLGMVYARKGQIVTYSQKDSDYVRQYEDIPEK